MTCVTPQAPASFVDLLGTASTTFSQSRSAPSQKRLNWSGFALTPILGDPPPSSSATSIPGDRLSARSSPMGIPTTRASAQTSMSAIATRPRFCTSASATLRSRGVNGAQPALLPTVDAGSPSLSYGSNPISWRGSPSVTPRCFNPPGGDNDRPTGTRSNDSHDCPAPPSDDASRRDRLHLR